MTKTKYQAARECKRDFFKKATRSREAVHRLTEELEKPDQDRNLIADLVGGGFDWTFMPEGSNYWFKISDRADRHEKLDPVTVSMLRYYAGKT